MTPEQAELEALGFKIPDSVTPVVAYRSWRLAGQGESNALYSHNGTHWTPGKALRARCPYFSKRHTAPDPSCICGIYSAKKTHADHIIPRSPTYVFGEVYLWGKIQEALAGYRGEYAYPKQFFVLDEKTKKQVEAMGFGVPVTVMEGDGYRFPFQVGPITRSQKLKRSPALVLFMGIPALSAGVADVFLLDMSKLINQVLVSLTLAIGLWAEASSIQIYRLRRRIRR